MGALGGGDFVVLRATGDDDYNKYIYELCHCDSVETIVVKSREAASDPWSSRPSATPRRCSSPAATSGNYVRFWKGTPLEDAINFVVAKPAPIGGTSAGMAILGRVRLFGDGPDSLTIQEALANPFDPDLTLERDFLRLPRLEGHDHRPAPARARPHRPHGDAAGSAGARRLDDAPRAIAADRETAVHIDPATGTAEVFATPKHPTPYVYFMRTPGARGGLRARPAAHVPQRRRLPHQPRRHISTSGRGRGGRHRLHAERGGRSAHLVARRDLLALRGRGPEPQLLRQLGGQQRAARLSARS